MYKCFAWMSVWSKHAWYLWRSGEKVMPPGTGVTDCHESPWELGTELRPQKELVLLSAEPAPRPLNICSILRISHHYGTNCGYVKCILRNVPYCLTPRGPSQPSQKTLCNQQGNILFVYKHLYVSYVSSTCFWEVNGEQIIIQGCPWRFIQTHLKHQPWKCS